MATPITAAELDNLYAQAVAKCGEKPNALGFLRRVEGSAHYRKPPARAPGRYASDYAASEKELQRAGGEFRLALHLGFWPTV